MSNGNIKFDFQMEQCGVSTSLGNIVLERTKETVQCNIAQLFVRKEYPGFELAEFYSHPLFSSHDKFHFFIDILEEWNRKVQKREIPAFSETLFQKNTFIYDTLKTATLHALPLAEHTLAHLYRWFTATRNTTVHPPRSPVGPGPSAQLQWQIRNTFKSNLPSEIGMYRRRIFWDYGKDKCMSAKLIDARKVHTEIEEDPKNEEDVRKDKDKKIKQLEEPRICKIQNALVRADIERKQFLSVQNKWKTKKNRESEASVKNYYAGSFNANKTYFPKAPAPPTTHNPVAFKRTQTSLGYRTSLRKAPEYNRFSQNDALLGARAGQRQFSFEEFEGGKENCGEISLGGIDGMRLLSNPFEKKLKKKKRRS